MRELKFRLFDKIDERYQGEDEYLGLTPDGESFIYIDETGEFEFLGTDDFIIEQYTGLKDKNGKEIYEGDIIAQFVCGVHNFKGKKCGRSTIWQVRWNEKECCFELHYLRGSLFGDSMMSDGDEYEVIGNVHENKELLK